ncbi:MULTISPECIES: hypothetical protein [Chryseobacterium]|jgi:hypothetical protein|uniref:Uncharacterized protein n=4 Tax=Chryseobacterium TaxID=59732 RepID=A0A376C233_CHRCU|nr:MULTISPECIES: hypothetical protein [Chryseobacterium]KNB61901.1 hypothetical protein AC804_07490 [Chryseobacterium sp. Hurlbut01]STA51356.1 Uncharacterised protein [Chryseobacterium carnipullorum]STA51376.1 Uncharacterised protein [Chryseobacterium carnipullorum]STA63152.1 Uncharacterised protein [Chryseobacterium indoltheticum]
MEENNNQNPARLSPAETVEQIKITTEALNRETQKLNSGISGIDQKLRESKMLIDHSLAEIENKISDIRINVSPEDIKKMEAYKDYFKHYKPIFWGSVFILFCSLGLAVFGASSGMKYYQESVRTKQEIRAQVLQEIESSGKVIVEKSKWDSYVEQSQVLRAWQKSNPKDSESLEIYYKGYQDFKKGKK